MFVILYGFKPKCRIVCHSNEFDSKYYIVQKYCAYSVNSPGYSSITMLGWKDLEDKHNTKELALAAMKKQKETFYNKTEVVKLEPEEDKACQS